MWIKRLPVLTAGLALGAALAACSSGSPQAASSPGRVSGASPDAQTAAIVACYRTHGDPSYPDPNYDPSDGHWHLDATAPASTRQACQHLFPSAYASPPVPQAQFQQLVKLAECIRQHGVPTWPDPSAAGAFSLPSALSPKSANEQQALRACQRYIPSGGINYVGGS